MTEELAALLKVPEPVIEKRQCVTLAVAAAVLWAEQGRRPEAQEVQRRAQDYRLEQTRLAVEALHTLGDPEEIVTAVEHEMRVYVHDLTTAHHEKDFRSLAVFPINDLQDVKVVVLRTDYRGGVIVESVVGPSWRPGGTVTWVLIHDLGAAPLGRGGHNTLGGGRAHNNTSIWVHVLLAQPARPDTYITGENPLSALPHHKEGGDMD